jgi:hypothetical protein
LRGPDTIPRPNLRRKDGWHRQCTTGSSHESTCLLSGVLGIDTRGLNLVGGDRPEAQPAQ